MSSLLIRATELSVGDTLLLPMGKTATVSDIKPVGPRTQYVRFRTEHGWTRVGVSDEVHVEAKVI